MADMNLPALVDEDLLAEVYDTARHMEKIGDLTAATNAYCQMLKLDPIDRAGAIIRLAALGKVPPPQKAPEAYVATLFNQQAGGFESILVDQLGYHVPLQMREMLEKQIHGKLHKLLDLGCGTGLVGDALFDLFDHITGVDLAELMIEATAEDDIYHTLFVGDAIQFLEENNRPEWDLISAADVLPYIGNLTRFFQAICNNLNASGYVCLSTESCDDGAGDFVVSTKHRFAHSEHYLKDTLEKVGLGCQMVQPVIVRNDQEEAIKGHLILAQKL